MIDFKITISIKDKTIERMIKRVESFKGDFLFEFRLDTLVGLKYIEMPEWLTRRLILTYRSPKEGGYDDSFTVDKLNRVIDIAKKNSVAYLDIESSMFHRLNMGTDLKDTKIIISQHIMHKKSSITDFKDAWRKWKDKGDLVKVVNDPKNYYEALLSVMAYNFTEPKRFISFSIGERWRFTRFASTLLGNPILYCCLPDEELAAGQPSMEQAVKFQESIRYAKL